MNLQAECPLCKRVPLQLLHQYTKDQLVGTCTTCNTISVVCPRKGRNAQEEFSYIVETWNQAFTLKTFVNEEPAYAQVIPPSSNTFYISMSLNISPEQSK